MLIPFWKKYCPWSRVWGLSSGALGVYAGIRRLPTSRFFWQRILTSVIINKQGTFRPFSTSLCVYPPPFLAIHHWVRVMIKFMTRIYSQVTVRVWSRADVLGGKSPAFSAALCHRDRADGRKQMMRMRWTAHRFRYTARPLFNRTIAKYPPTERVFS